LDTYQNNLKMNDLIINLFVVLFIAVLGGIIAEVWGVFPAFAFCTGTFAVLCNMVHNTLRPTFLSRTILRIIYFLRFLDYIGFVIFVVDFLIIEFKVIDIKTLYFFLTLSYSGILGILLFEKAKQ